jgi:hypothetical protein
MSPEVFESLGKHGDGKAGRMTMNRLRNAVSSVLSAWTNWSVYNTNFLDLLECRFEGRDYVAPKLQQNINESDGLTNNETADLSSDQDAAKNEQEVVSTIPRGAWTTSLPISDDNVDGEALDDEADGEALDKAADFEKKEMISTVPRGQWTFNDVDGEELDADELDGIDGEALDDEDLDGDALDDGDEVINN